MRNFVYGTYNFEYDGFDRGGDDSRPRRQLAMLAEVGADAWAFQECSNWRDDRTRAQGLVEEARNTTTVLTRAAEILDFTQPVALLLLAILHFIPEPDAPRGIVSRYAGALAPGSYLAISHATPESFADPAGREQLNKVYAETASGGVTPRPKAEIGRFFSGLEMIEPGLVNITAWRPNPGDPETRALFYGGLARKEG